MPKILNRSFYERDSCLVAKELLGTQLVRQLREETLRGKIVEVEAYYGKDDPASHASTEGKTNRNRIMWTKPGTAYVYLIYGVHHLFNVVTEPEGEAGAVLIRAVEPLAGAEKMTELRDLKKGKGLTDGPGKLTQALKITDEYNGWDLTEGNRLWLERGERGEAKIRRSGRIGISRGEELKYRFFLEGNPFLSNN